MDIKSSFVLFFSCNIHFWILNCSICHMLHMNIVFFNSWNPNRNQPLDAGRSLSTFLSKVWNGIHTQSNNWPHEHILPINFISNTWVVVVSGYFASTLRKSNRNFITLSPLQGPENPYFSGMTFIPPLFREPFSLITLALLLLLWFPLSFHCCSIWALGYWFSFSGLNLNLDQAEPDQLTLTLIHLKAIWTADFSFWLLKLTPSAWHYIWNGPLKR